MSLLHMNRISQAVTVQRLNESVIYRPETGGFLWRVRPDSHFKDETAARRWNAKYAGKAAFTSKCPRGYLRGCLDQQPLYAHRAAIAILSGEWPIGEVDHIDGNKSNNQGANLRVVTHRENRMNTRDCKSPTAGLRQGKSGQWVAVKKIGGKNVYLGTFYSLEAAQKARASA